MSYYVNQAQLASVFVDGVDVTDRVLSWIVSDSSLNNVGAMQTTGELRLGQPNGLADILNYGRDRYRRGTEVIVEVRKSDGTIVRHPRGLLYVIADSFSPDSSVLTIEIGCRIALANLTEDVSQILPLVPVPLDPAQNDYQSISGSFAAGASYIYQDNQGGFQTGEFFEGDAFGAVTPGSWVSIYGQTSLNVSPLQSGGAIPDSITLSYSYPSDGLTQDNKGKVVQDEAISNYFLQYPGTVYIRSRLDTGIPGATTPERNNSGVTSSCGNSPSSPGQAPNRPNSCSDGYSTESTTITQPARRVATSETVYDGPGGQTSYSLKEVRGPAIEVNGQYYSDAYASCRYSYATACNPGGSCPLEGMEVILQGYQEEFFTYDNAGALQKKTTDTYKNILAAAQPFNWRAGNVNGSAQGFVPLSTIDYYLSSRVINEYEESDNFRIETTTTYTSVAEQGSGIGSTASDVIGAITSLSNPTQFPLIDGSFTNLVTTTTGGGIGLKVNVNFGGVGSVQEFGNLNAVTSLPVWSTRIGVPLFGGSGTGILISYEYRDQRFKLFTIDQAGSGYKVGDVLSLHQPPVGNPLFTFTAVVTQVTPPVVATTVAQAGEGYFDGDIVWVTPDTIAQAAAATGQIVDLSNAPNLTYTVRKTSNSDGNGAEQVNAATQFQLAGNPPSLLAGAYRRVPTEADQSNGENAVVDLFVTRSGGATRLNQTEAVQLGYNSYDRYKRYGFRPRGGSGSGLVVSLRFNDVIGGDPGGYINVNDIIRDGFNLLGIEEGGGGYRPGDVVTIPFADIFESFPFRVFAGDYATSQMSFQIGAISPTSAEVYSAIGGNDYAVGDILKITGSTLVAAGAARTNPGDLKIKVTQVSQGVSASNISINAMNGVITRNINRSTTFSTLPLAPDLVNSPITDTKDGESVIVLRRGQAATQPVEADNYISKRSIPVPLLFTSDWQVEDAVKTYERYTESFVLGDALGLQILEGLRDEIIDNWKPGLSFRFYDPRCEKLIALRMDAVTWGITPTEAACSINGIYLGESDGTVTLPRNTVGDEAVGALPATGGGQSAGSIRAATEPRPTVVEAAVVNETTINQGDYLKLAYTHSSLQIEVTFKLVIGGNSQGESVAQNISPQSQTVVYVSGAIVEPGSLLSPEANGGMPYEYNGSLLVTGTVILLDPFNQ